VRATTFASICGSPILKPPEGAALAILPAIPRDVEGPVFPTASAARAFAMVVALHERRLFTWSEWSSALGAEVARGGGDGADPETYWRAWLTALESILATKALARPDDLAALRGAWSEAAAATPHGQPIELPARHRF
jgi:nitrile hydratase accessory protein